MPTYQYTCTECGEQVEVVQKFTDDALTVCPACGGRLRKVFSPVGIVFKGSGFYRTDSRKGSSSDGPAKDGRQGQGIRRFAKPSDSSSGSSKDSGSGSSGSGSSDSSSSSSSSGSGSGSSGSGLVGLGSGSSSSSAPARARVPVVGLRVFGQKGQQEFGAGRLGLSRSLPCPRESTRRRVSHPAEVGSAGASLPNLARADIGVIGGSGFYEFLESADEVSVDTPYGVPSDPIVTGEVAGRKVAFVPRHGRDHRFPPHASPTGRTCGRCARSASGRSWPRPRWARSTPRTAPAGWPSPTRSWTGPPAAARPSTRSGAQCTSRSPTPTARPAGPRPSRPPAPRAGTWPSPGRWS